MSKDLDNIRELLRKYDIRPSKKSGQSFLTNQIIARDIVGHADISKTDTVLEIGGGLGILTRWLADVAQEVLVIEIDKGLVRALTEKFESYENVRIIHGDALRVNLPQVDKVVSNLPYSISSEITFRLLKELDFELAVMMYQKEFAHRLIANPCTPEYSRLTVNFSYLASVEALMDVLAEEFFPIPAVDSTVVKVEKRKTGPFAKDDAIFTWLVRGIYSYPNKQVRRAISIWFRRIGVDKQLVKILIEKTEGQVNPTNRLRCLTLKQLVKLSDVILDMILSGELLDPRGESSEN